MFDWLRLRADSRCDRCGLQLRIDDAGVRRRYFVDPDLWSVRCKEIGDGVDSPFDCPHLKRMARRRAPDAVARQ